MATLSDRPHRPINVLVFETILAVGGAERVTYDLITRFDRSQVNVVVCTLYQPGVIGQWLADRGYPCFSHLMRFRFDPLGLVRLWRLTKEQDIDVIYLVSQPMTVVCASLIGWIRRIPTIPVLHTPEPMHTTIRRRLYRHLLRHQRFLIAVSESLKSHLVRVEGLRAESITVIRNGVDPDGDPDGGHGPGPPGLPFGPEHPLVGVVGRLEAFKGVDMFLRAAARVLESCPTTRFLVVGHGPDREELEAMAADLGIGGKVAFLGHRSDVFRVVGRFDVGVLCSRLEAMPLTVLEYMACGKPVVATDVGSIAEVVVDSETGFVIETDNLDKLVDRIVRLLMDSENRERMGRAGRERVLERYDVETSARATEEVITRAFHVSR